MKFAFKTLVATAAFVAAGVASATPYAGYWQVVSGSGSLTFSSSALSALAASGSSIVTNAVVPYIGLDISGAINTAAYTKTTGNIALTFSSAVINGDALTSLKAANSLVEIRRNVLGDDDETVTRYSVFLANFEVNLATSSISADLYSRVNAGALVNYGTQDIFQATNVGVVTGGTQGNIVVGAADVPNWYGTASGGLSGALRMNASTANIILASLSLDTTGDVANLVKNADWGTTYAQGTFTAPVPEPSTYGLFGAGLLAMGMFARRRKAA